jgi:transcription-repair coupling factor (superfamily II helicase)
MHPSLLVGKTTHRDLDQLLGDKRRLIISGTSNETAKALLVGSIYSFTPRPSLIVTGNSNNTEALSHWLHFFDIEAERLDPIENENEEIVPDALQAFLRFMQKEHTQAFICDRETWDASFPAYTDLQERKMVLREKQPIDFTEVVETLISLGYSHGEDLYLSPGEYRRTGDTFDIYPIQSNHSFRISLEFDAVENILSVDSEDLSKT